jgi:putative ATPase
MQIPLAEFMRPKSIGEVIGQQHLIGSDGILYRSLENNKLPSIIFWGPPGVGKTSLAKIMAQAVQSHFIELSAINAGVKEVREAIASAQNFERVILFIDEIHRFSKSQQDALLGAVEKGIITLIGATTENPSFEVIPALLSRCQIFTLKALQEEELIQLLKRAQEALLKYQNIKIEILENKALLAYSGGDARKLLNLLEHVVNSLSPNQNSITDSLVVSVAGKKIPLYDKNGEMHYDLVSALIKSIRGSDPNAAIYWLARMIEGGEDLEFIARRLVISSSEDIGNANPTALVIATECFNAVRLIGYPEASIVLAQCVTYLASSAKSNSSYVAIKNAIAEVSKSGNLPVPMHLRNAPTALMKNEGYGKNYQYAHDYANNFVNQEYMPANLSNKVFYKPGSNPREQELRERLKYLWKEKYGY